MSAPEKPAPIVPFAVMPKEPVANVVSDDSGRSIMALLQKAGEMAKEDCARAMDLAHKLSFQLRAAEERLQELSPRRRIIVIAPRAPSNGSCASIMRSSRHSPRKTSGILLTAVSVRRRDPHISDRDSRAR